MWHILVISLFVGVVSANFNDNDKRDILAVHNGLRSKVALGQYVAKGNHLPSAANMYALRWNSQLENSAQNYANRCLFQHSGTNGVGENLYMMMASYNLNIDGKGKDASNSWANEFQDKGWNSIHMTPDLFNTGVGHASQMVWANTHDIGCGAALCNNNHDVIVVCQYSPPGNYMGQDIYQTGQPCSRCPSGCQGGSGLCN